MIHAFIIGITLFAFGYYQLGPYPKWSYYGAFLLKSLATIGIGYYFLSVMESGDTLGYFYAASDFNKTHATGLTSYLAALTQADIPGHASNWHSVFFIKMISPLVYLADYNYWLTALYLTLVNFLLSWLSIRYLVSNLQNRWLVYLAVFCIPSVVAWSGGIFKESIANGIFLLTMSIGWFRFNKWSRPSYPEIMFLLLGSLILFQLRFYLLGALIGFFVCVLWFRIFNHRRVMQWMGILGLLILGFFAAQLLHPWLRPSRLPLTLFENYQQILSNESSSNFTIPGFKATYLGILIATPMAIISGWFRPFLWELPSIYWLAFGLEKAVLVIFSLLTIWSLKNRIVKNEAWLALLWIVIMTVGITLATPNFGSLIRYTSAFLPFLFLLVASYPLRKIDAIH